MAMLNKKQIKLYWPKIASIIFLILLVISYARIFAISRFQPGETLNPDCPPGAVDCTVNISGGSQATYTNSNPTQSAVGGINAGSSFAGQTMQEMFDRLLYPYLAPTISLSLNPSNGVIREFGNPVSVVNLSATTTKRSNPITEVSFYKNGTLINTSAAVKSLGGVETYSDVSGVATNGITYQARVSDETESVSSATLAYTFVYPFYAGVGAKNLTGAEIRNNLNTLVKTQSNTVTVSSPSSQVFYLAYPANYPALSSILDQNGFETISDYTLRTVSIVGLDGSAQNYKVYEFKNLTTQTNFTNTFKF